MRSEDESPVNILTRFRNTANYYEAAKSSFYSTLIASYVPNIYNRITNFSDIRISLIIRD